MDTPRKVLRQLRKLAEAITDQIDCPNYGGCGVIAARVALALESHGYPVEVTTHVGNEGWYSKPADVRHLVNPGRMRSWSENGVSFRHLAVRFKLNGRVYLWDSDTGPMRRSLVYGYDDQYIASKWGTGMTPDECRAVSDNPEGWNESFDRDQIPAIDELVVTFLNPKE